VIKNVIMKTRIYHILISFGLQKFEIIFRMYNDFYRNYLQITLTLSN